MTDDERVARHEALEAKVEESLVRLGDALLFLDDVRDWSSGPVALGEALEAEIGDKVDQYLCAIAAAKVRRNLRQAGAACPDQLRYRNAFLLSELDYADQVSLWNCLCQRGLFSHRDVAAALQEMRQITGGAHLWGRVNRTKGDEQ